MLQLKKLCTILFGLFFCCLMAESDSLRVKLLERNFDFSGYWGWRVEKELKIPNRVQYFLQGDVPLSATALNFLFENLPLTAEMVNVCQKTNYKVTYIGGDKKRFLARVKGLTGEMVLLTPYEQVDKRIYYGSGEGNFLWWHLYGTVLALLDIEPSDVGCHYVLRVYLFNESEFVNGLLSMGFVRWVIEGRIEKILGHIVSSAEQFRKEGSDFLVEDERFQSEESKKFLQEFLRLDSLSNL